MDCAIGKTIPPPRAVFEGVKGEAQAKGKKEVAELVNFSILRGLPLAGKESHTMRTRVTDDGVLTIESHREGANEPFGLLVRSRVRAADTTGLDSHKLDLTITHDDSVKVKAEAFYQHLQLAGLNYADAFLSVAELWFDKTKQCAGAVCSVLARLSCPSPLYANSALGIEAKLCTVPPLVDAAMQSVFAAVGSLLSDKPKNAQLTHAYLPVFFGRVLMLADKIPAWSKAVIKRVSAMTLTVDIELFDKNGQCVGLLQDLRLRRAPKAARLQPSAYTEVWAAPCLSLPRFEALPAVSPAREGSNLRGWDWQDASQLATVLIGAYAYQAVSRKGEWQPAELLFSGSGFTVNEAAARWLAQVMAQSGYALTQTEIGETLYNAVESPDYTADILFQTLMATYPAYWSLWMRMQRVGKNLAALLSDDTTLEKVRGELPAMLNDLGAATPTVLLAQKELIGALQTLVDRIEAYAPMTLQIKGLIRADNFERAESIIAATSDRVHWTIVADGSKLVRAKALFEARYHVEVLDIIQAPLHQFAVVVVPEGCGRDKAASLLVQKLASTLIPNGFLLSLEEAPNAISNFLEGLDAQWWGADVQDRPVSRLIDKDSWGTIYADAHLRNLTEHLSTLFDSGVCEPYYIAVAQNEKVDSVTLEKSKEEDKPTLLLVLDPEDSRSVQLAQRFSEIASRSIDLLCASHDLSKVTPEFQQKLLTESATTYALQHPNVPVISLVDSRQGADQAPKTTLALAQAFVRDGITNPWTIVGFENKVSARALLGFKRVVENEQPQLDLRWAGLCDESNETLCAFLSWVAGEAVGGINMPVVAHETEIEVQNGQKFVPEVRVHRHAGANPENPIELAFDVPGKLDRLYWKRVPAKPLADDEVRVSVRATALNFRDVMWAMGLLPEEALENGFSGPTMGLEAAGVVTEVGSSVTKFKPGDAVLAFAPACFASEIVTREDAVARKPEALSFEEAAGVPVAFFTAWYAIVEMGRAQKGESILIHGAAGGVGLAAIQIAQLLGLTIYATAGTQAKRDLVRALGVEHVYDSRSLAFVDAVRRDTKGVGVDLVLNSLAGNAAEQSLSLLTPFGRFLELGKRDFYADNPVYLRPFGRNLSYYGIDVDQLLTQKPRVGERVFADVMHAFEEGSLTALPVTVFGRREAARAFALMQSASHVGKIVVTMDDTTSDVTESRPSEMQVDPNGTYVITGGLGGLGAAAAQKLASLGVKSLVLISRRGVTTDEQKQIVDGLMKQGVTVTTPQLDTAADDFAQQLTAAVRDLPPVTGIIHAAGLIDDAMVMDLTPARMQATWDPKVRGALSLLKFVKDNGLVDQLTCFVLFSSATTLLGNLGQANYVAANMAYEGLIDELPEGKVTVIGWGPVGDVGMLKNSPKVKAALEATIGTPCLTSREVVDAMSALAADRGVSSAHFMAIDWRRVQSLPVMQSPRFNAVREKAVVEADAKNLKATLVGKSHDEVTAILTKIVQEETARIMGMAQEELSLTQPLSDIGMDSLTVLELACALEERTSVRMSSAAGFAGANIRTVAERLAASLTDEADQDEAMLSAISRQHGVELSDELKQAALKA